MNTEIIKSNAPDFNEKLKESAEILKKGGLVVFPTETVYGLGGDARNPESAKKIYQAKGRPSDNPLIIHIAKPEEAETYAETNELYYRLAKAFMPGPLTVILPKKDTIPTETTGGLDTVAIRCPSHPIAMRLISLCGFPIAAPSANISGKPSPTDAENVIQDMNGRVDAVIDGGECEIGLESTIVLIKNDKLVLLRPGGITYDALSIIAETEISSAVTKQLEKDEKPLSPGMKYRHYAPDAPVVLLTGTEEKILSFLKDEQVKKKCGILCYDEEVPELKPEFLYPVGKRNDLQTQAHTLFRNLRDADKIGADVIYAHLPPMDGLGLALYNRMIRASAHTVKEIT